jgi:polyferredoxin
MRWVTVGAKVELAREGKRQVVGDGWRNQELRRVTYRLAWLYLCAWVVTLPLGAIPAVARLASIVLATVALATIVVTLVGPRPTQAHGSTMDAPSAGPAE